MERHIPKTGEIYRHFKNKMYQIVTVATHSETGGQLVIYQALYGDFSCCARPLEMFMSKVDKAKYPQAAQEYRFELVDKDSLTKVHKTTENNVMENNITGNNVTENNITEDNITEDNVTGNNVEAVVEKTIKNADEELPNPDLLLFLDADTFEEKKNLLVSMQNRMTDELINSIAASLDISVDEGDLETRFKSLYNCVSTMSRYEVNNRLR